MKKTQRMTTILALLAAVVCTPASADTARYEVSITNITRGQTFTPIMLATHKPGVRLFKLGQPASSELAIIAESGNPGPLMDALTATGKTVEVKNSGGLLAPGATITMMMEGENARYISMASMLIPTNDAFLALNAKRLPRGRHAVTYKVPAYDAGSEPNDELCVNIPGPVCGGAGLSADTYGEGYVHLHAGIHSQGDDINSLNASERDWNNPVAIVRIKRIQ